MALQILSSQVPLATALSPVRSVILPAVATGVYHVASRKVDSRPTARPMSCVSRARPQPQPLRKINQQSLVRQFHGIREPPPTWKQRRSVQASETGDSYVEEVAEWNAEPAQTITGAATASFKSAATTSGRYQYCSEQSAAGEHNASKKSQDASGTKESKEGAAFGTGIAVGVLLMTLFGLLFSMVTSELDRRDSTVKSEITHDIRMGNVKPIR